MSVPNAAPRGDAMSLSVIRGLLERNLVERAAVLAETRWSGSGELVRLAHEWAELTPVERRDRLSAIGPEDLARLRGIADLQPDLARVLDDLEARGVIPPAETLVADAGAPPMTPEEAVVDAVLDVAQERAEEYVREADIPDVRTFSEMHSRLATARDSTVLNPTPEQLPSEFLASELERRAEATERGAEILERVRRRVEAASERVGSSALGDVLASGATRAVEPGSTNAPVVERAALTDSIDPIVKPGLVQAIMSHRIHELEPGLDRPSDDDLKMAARELGLGFVRIDGNQYAGRELYGGLVRKGRGIVEEAGFLPRALAGRNLVVFSGRVYPTALARIDEGYFDIPGTRASTRVHPDSRLVLLAE